ncbi:MAG TPA: DUF5709 domain-containing protein [Actinomycetota bacterium]|nr:DUF5709 domain-containing protein [Actinomycetota bacterium]
MDEDELETGLPPDLSPDYNGIPDTIEASPPFTSGKMVDQAMAMPADEPTAVFGRVTAAEEVAGETLEERLRQEEPDVPERPTHHPGRLIAPESGVDEMDLTKEEVAFQATEAGMGLTAEEAAIHIDDESALG